MKFITIFLISLCTIVSYGQTNNETEILINKVQMDDTYSAGESILVNAVIHGDLVIAGGSLTVNDSIYGDLTAAGGELYLNSKVADDVRIAVGKVTIDSEVGDDLIVFGGEVILTENAKINGNLRCFAGTIEVNGEVLGMLDIKGADVLINGSIRETSKIIGEDVIIGSNAKFHKEVEYYSSDGEIDFRDTLVNTTAHFNKDLAEEKSDLSLTTFGTTTLSLWIFYVLSAFLVILVLHGLFRNTFSAAVVGLEKNWVKSFGFGLIYLFGIPLLIILALLMIIGIPLGLLAMVIFIFSILFGHLIAALLIVYYFKNLQEKDWGFWSITVLALICAIILRLLTIIPFAGILVSVVLLSITYGALTLKVLRTKKEIIEN